MDQIYLNRNTPVEKKMAEKMVKKKKAEVITIESDSDDGSEQLFDLETQFPESQLPESQLPDSEISNPCKITQKRRSTPTKQTKKTPPSRKKVEPAQQFLMNREKALRIANRLR